MRTQINNLAPLLIGLLFIQTVFANTNVSLRLNRESLAMGETVQMTITVEGEESIATPDLSALEKDFKVVGTGTQNQYHVVNGNTTSLAKWVVSMMPKRTGKLTIPALTIGHAKTEPKIITVTSQVNSHDTHEIAPASADDIFMETSLSPASPYVQSQGLYTLRLFYDRNVQNAQLTEPHVDDFLIYQIGQDKQFDKMIKGRRYQVLERHYAFIPQASGDFIIKSPVFNGKVFRSTQSENDYYGLGWQPIKITSQDISVQVKPIPANLQQPWLPAESLKLTTHWSQPPDKLQLGEPVTFTVTLSAKGVTAEQLPAITLPDSDSLQVYPDKPQLNTTTDGKTLLAKRIEKFAIIPNQAGSIQLPEIQVNWWDTTNESPAVAQIPAIQLQVADTGAAHAAPNPLNLAPSSLHTEDPEENMGALAVQSLQSQPWQINRWTWLAFAMAGAWLLTTKLWLGARRPLKALQQQQSSQQARKEQSLRQAKDAFKKAIKANDAAKTKQAILDWANTLWPKLHFRTLGDVENYVTAPEAKAALSALDKHLYTGKKQAWDAETCEKALLMNLYRETENKGKSSKNLPPLYPE